METTCARAEHGLFPSNGSNCNCNTHPQVVQECIMSIQSGTSVFSGFPTMPTNAPALERAQRLWSQIEPGLMTTQEQIDQAWRERQQELYGDPNETAAHALFELRTFLHSSQLDA